MSRLDIVWEQAPKPKRKGAKRKWPKAYVDGVLVAFLQPIDGRGFVAREAHDLELIVWVCDYSEGGINGHRAFKLHEKADGLDDAAEKVYEHLKANRKLLPGWRPRRVG